ncbi:DUF2846 domain-containing protein [Sutcliffiella deserti]|uniref:DUF2846 domain-containing protein n=1 Tax=Sutcliffiella deserti TaxID=2875501 RepID=UPI001CC11304|nr:DUF2846 domain-containing protein [Sutcliffiella deserti]
MKKISCVFVCLVLMLLVACKEDQQKPEANVATAHQEASIYVKEVSAVTKKPLTMTVHHRTKNQQVYVECIVAPDFHFTEKRKKKKYGEGHLDVYLNNKKIGVFSQGAFILKDLEKGKHSVTMKLIHNDETEYGIAETFEVNVK